MIYNNLASLIEVNNEYFVYRSWLLVVTEQQARETQRHGGILTVVYTLMIEFHFTISQNTSCTQTQILQVPH